METHLKPFVVYGVMGKYNYKNGLFKGKAKIKMLMFIANELAELNRLKRLELTIEVIGTEKLNKDCLEDKSI